MKTTQIIVSIIIPTYKPQDYLWECLSSIKAQNFPQENFEIIIILNGEKEPYYSQINQYINEHGLHNLILKYTPVSGVSNARNIGLDIASGEYFIFIDDDDYISPSFLEKMYKDASPTTIVISNVIAIDDKTGEQIKYSKTENYMKYSNIDIMKFYKARKFFSGPWMKIIHSEIIRDKRYNCDFSIGEDSLFMFLISDKMKFVSFAPKDAIYYRRVRENSALTRKRSRFEIVYNSIRLIIEYSKIYFSYFPKYNLNFYVTRIMGAIKSIFIFIKGTNSRY